MLSQKMSFSLFYNFIKIVATCHCKDIRSLFPSEQNSGLSSPSVRFIPERAPPPKEAAAKKQINNTWLHLPIFTKGLLKLLFGQNLLGTYFLQELDRLRARKGKLAQLPGSFKTLLKV